ncbi:MAG: cbb3-type cytochrome c oxidase subunit I [Chloroflexi bacterium]|nr:cbb3-type cytochrome c oxidase subunit I [Chloroflexota bacterium]
MRSFPFARRSSGPLVQPAPLTQAPPTGAGQEGRAARWFLYSAVFWLVVPGVAGLLMAAFLFAPYLHERLPLDLRPYLQFGRLRPVHVNTALFGWLSMAYAGAMLFIVPRLTRAPLYSERLALVNVVLWNVTMVGAFFSLLLGFNQGREYAELAWPLDWLMIANYLLLAVNLWGTTLRRREPRVYISVWNFMAASLIIAFVYGIGNVVWDPAGALTGMNDAILNYFYVHNLFNAWFTTGGIGLVYYLLPKLSGNPVWSYRLAVWGFASVWTGQHHLLYAPGPDWLEALSVAFSILAAVPNTAFAYNFFMTMQGAWSKARSDVPLRFLATGCIFYLLTCIQGVAQSFRTFNSLVHFTNWVIGHSHLAFVASFSFIAFALVYHILPRLQGSSAGAFSRRVMEWHYWLTLVGIVVFMVVLWTAGLVQGRDWLAGGVPFMDTVRAMRPYMLLRLLAGGTIGAGVLLFAYNVARTLRSAPKPAPPRERR